MAQPEFDLRAFSERIFAETDLDAPRVTFEEVGALLALAGRAFAAEFELKRLKSDHHRMVTAMAEAAGGHLIIQRSDMLHADTATVTRWTNEMDDTFHVQVSRP